MGRAWLAVLLFGACGSDAGTAVAEQSVCETRQAFLAPSIAQLDIILDIDVKAPMVVPDYDAKLRSIGALFESTSADFHIQVAGALATCTTDGLPYLTSRSRPEAPPVTNFAGTLGDALACLGEAQRDIYFGLDRALVVPGFRRDEYLLLIFVDTGPAFGPLPKDTTAVAIFAPLETAPDWIGLVAPGTRVTFGTLESDWADRLSSWFPGPLNDTFPPCVTGPVVSRAECVVTETSEITGAAEILRYCPDRSGPRPCWWDDPAPTVYTCPGGFAYHVERDEFPSFYSVDDVRCPLTCP